MMNTPPPTRRPLSSLTEEECAELYRLAMDRFGLIAGTLRDTNGGWVDIQSDEFTLYIMSNGHMSVTAELTGEAHAFNAVAVVRFLDGLGIQLG